MENREPLDTYRVTYKCSCGGLMKNRATYLSNPPKYQHVCEKCDSSLLLEKSYPYLDYTPSNRTD